MASRSDARQAPRHGDSGLVEPPIRVAELSNFRDSLADILPTAAGIDNSWTYRISKGLQVVAGCAPTAMVDVADADFFNYGFWLKRTTDEDGVLMYDEVETFAGSSIDASDSVAAVTGTAIATALRGWWESPGNPRRRHR